MSQTITLPVPVARRRQLDRAIAQPRVDRHPLHAVALMAPVVPASILAFLRITYDVAAVRSLPVLLAVFAVGIAAGVWQHAGQRSRGALLGALAVSITVIGGEASVLCLAAALGHESLQPALAGLAITAPAALGAWLLASLRPQPQR